MGFDDPKSLGGREFGATVAMPIWIDYMRVALAKRPPVERPVPAGLTQLNGEWLYDEFMGDAAVHSLDLDSEPATPEDAAAPPAVPAAPATNVPPAQNVTPVPPATPAR